MATSNNTSDNILTTLPAELQGVIAGFIDGPEGGPMCNVFGVVCADYAVFQCFRCKRRRMLGYCEGELLVEAHVDFKRATTCTFTCNHPDDVEECKTIEASIRRRHEVMAKWERLTISIGCLNGDSWN